jgi:hypothetical protein
VQVLASATIESISLCSSAPSIGAIECISRHVEFATASTMSMHASFGTLDELKPFTHEPIRDITRGPTVCRQPASHMPDTIDDH